MKIKSIKPSKLVLCGKSGSCCPTIHFDIDNNVTITDDFGGSVKISAAEFAILGDKLKEIFE
jgi:hypothetical protein